MLLDRAVAHWVHNGGVSHEINWAWDELKTVERLVPGLVKVPEYSNALTELTVDSNERLFDLVETSSRAYEAGDTRGPDLIAAQNETSRIRTELITLRNNFVRENASTLLDAIDVNEIRGPVMAPQIH